MKFLLNMQIIVDDFEEVFHNIQFYQGSDIGRLEGFQFYCGEKTLDYKYVYIAKGSELPPEISMNYTGSLIILGKAPDFYIHTNFSVITLPEDTDLMLLVNTCQNVFHKNECWASELKNILIHDGGVDDLCKASYKYFKDPLFVHDSQFYIVSCPVWKEGMIKWELDKPTGLTIVPMDIINQFKFDKEYADTLTTTGSQIFSASLRGYRDIYVNIWDDYGKYEGRLCICEFENSLKPGQLLAAEYLSKFVKLALERRNQSHNTYSHALEVFLDRMVHGEKYSEDEIIQRIDGQGWKLNDEYLCIRMDIEDRDRTIMSVVSTCKHIETCIPGSKTFYNKVRICIVINLTVNSHHLSDISYILREGLFKAGISNNFNDFTKLHDHYRQASIALKYCKQNNDMRWSAAFEEIALDYMIDSSCPDLNILYICSDKLRKLIKHDENTASDLFLTLKIYVENERNTVKTAKDLYISRSTLFYRLRKIKELVDLDAEKIAEPSENLYLRLSFYILERKNILSHTSATPHIHSD